MNTTSNSTNKYLTGDDLEVLGKSYLLKAKDQDSPPMYLGKLKNREKTYSAPHESYSSNFNKFEFENMPPGGFNRFSGVDESSLYGAKIFLEKKDDRPEIYSQMQKMDEIATNEKGGGKKSKKTKRSKKSTKKSTKKGKKHTRKHKK